MAIPDPIHSSVEDARHRLSVAPMGPADLTFAVMDGMGVGFESVLALRVHAYGRTEAGSADPVDAHSYHVTASTTEGRIVGALRVTCRRDGPLESESAYPVWVLEEFGHRLSACSRLCLDPAVRTKEVPLALMRHAWREGLRRGVRLDASKARRRAIPYYLRLGSYFVRGSLFMFDRWQVECGLVVMAASPHTRGPLADLFRALVDPADIRHWQGSELTADVGDIRRELTFHAEGDGR